MQQCTLHPAPHVQVHYKGTSSASSAPYTSDLPVQESVSHASAPCIFRPVHLAPEVAAPLRDDDCQRDVAADGDEHDQGHPGLQRTS